MGPWCGQVRVWLEDGACLGVPDFWEQFELSSWLTWSHIKGIGGDRR